MMKVYQKEIIVTRADLDELDHVNNIRYVRWIQDISRDHWTRVAPADFRQKYVWVVRRHEIDYRKPAFLDDLIEVKTFIAESRGSFSTRIVEISCQGDPLVHARTKWCLLDATSLRPQRIPRDIANLFS